MTEASEDRLRLAWVPAAGSTGYRLVWRLAEGECAWPASQHPCQTPRRPPSPLSPARTGGPPRSQQLPATASSYDLGGLEPGRRYHISITSLAGGRESEPATVTAITGKRLCGAKGALDLWHGAGAQRGTQRLVCPSLGLGSVMDGELGLRWVLPCGARTPFPPPPRQLPQPVSPACR